MEETEEEEEEASTTDPFPSSRMMLMNEELRRRREEEEEERRIKGDVLIGMSLLPRQITELKERLPELVMDAREEEKEEEEEEKVKVSEENERCPVEIVKKDCIEDAEEEDMRDIAVVMLSRESVDAGSITREK